MGCPMTSAEWLTSSDPEPMLRYLIGTEEPRVQAVEMFPHARGSDRKLRLFACYCYHRVSHLLPHHAARTTVQVAERFADGTASVAEFLKAEAAVRKLVDALEPRWRASDGAERTSLHPTHAALALAGIVCWSEPQKAAWYAASNAHLELPYLANPGVGVHSRQRWEGEVAEKQAQCDLLRDIFGNPFHPVTLNPAVFAWNDATVARLARSAYDERHLPSGELEPSRIAVLADALEEAGAADESVAHLRGSGPHVRGCWAVDLCLGLA
jgi:hypothetical protein